MSAGFDPVSVVLEGTPSKSSQCSVPSLAEPFVPSVLRNPSLWVWGGEEVKYRSFEAISSLLSLWRCWADL